LLDKIDKFEWNYKNKIIDYMKLIGDENTKFNYNVVSKFQHNESFKLLVSRIKKLVYVLIWNDVENDNNYFIENYNSFLEYMHLEFLKLTLEHPRKKIEQFDFRGSETEKIEEVFGKFDISRHLKNITNVFLYKFTDRDEMLVHYRDLMLRYSEFKRKIVGRDDFVIGWSDFGSHEKTGLPRQKNVEQLGGMLPPFGFVAREFPFKQVDLTGEMEKIVNDVNNRSIRGFDVSMLYNTNIDTNFSVKGVFRKRRFGRIWSLINIREASGQINGFLSDTFGLTGTMDMVATDGSCQYASLSSCICNQSDVNCENPEQYSDTLRRIAFDELYGESDNVEHSRYYATLESDFDSVQQIKINKRWFLNPNNPQWGRTSTLFAISNRFKIRIYVLNELSFNEGTSNFQVIFILPGAPVTPTGYDRDQRKAVIEESLKKLPLFLLRRAEHYYPIHTLIPVT
jgi:hypothetical protein